MKAEIAFQLETAPWPAFLVTPTGVLEDVNLAAQTFFGDRLESREFTAIGEAETSSVSFLSLCDQLTSPLVPLKFRGSDGGVSTFLTSISSLTISSQKYYLFQLFAKSGKLSTGNTSF